jgi:hypothetical protein
VFAVIVLSMYAFYAVMLYGDVAEAAVEAMRRFHLAREGVDLLLTDGTDLPDGVRDRLVEIQDVLVLPKRPVSAQPVAVESTVESETRVLDKSCKVALK